MSQRPGRTPTTVFKSHSQIKTLLTSAGVVGSLTEPPKAFLAILVDETTNETHSVRFLYQGGFAVESGDAMVLRNLLQKYRPYSPLACVELVGETLGYFLCKNFKTSGAALKIPGREIRYALKASHPVKKHSSINWERLPDNVSVQIITCDPWIIDSDAWTVECNTKEARTLLTTTLQKLDTDLEILLKKKDVILETLQHLPEVRL